MATDYNYTISGDFPSGLDPSFLDQTIIDDVTITTTLVGTSVAGDNVTIRFVSALSGPEVTQLNVIVAAHDPANAPIFIKEVSEWLFTDDKTIGTDAGTFTNNTWVTRTLNTTFATDPYSTQAALSSNQVTLQPGTYDLSGTAPAYRCGDHVLRIRNITDSTTVAIGQSSYSSSSSQASQTLATVEATVQYTSTKVLELQHQCTSTRNTNGLGRATGVGTEKYAIFKVKQVI